MAIGCGCENVRNFLDLPLAVTNLPVHKNSSINTLLTSWNWRHAIPQCYRSSVKDEQEKVGGLGACPRKVFRAMPCRMSGTPFWKMGYQLLLSLIYAPRRKTGNEMKDQQSTMTLPFTVCACSQTLEAKSHASAPK